jgi:hypothetical protein
LQKILDPATHTIVEDMSMSNHYKVSRLNGSVTVDGRWDKPQWKNIRPIEIARVMGAKPGFLPVVHAKMVYDDHNLYVIFQVQDRFVRCMTKEINGPVWEDACVEFFFSPDTREPEFYFNLEINCGGTPLMHYNTVPRKVSVHLDSEDIRNIEIAHSLPQIIDPEMTEPLTWTLEYRIPLTLLEKYAPVTRPEKGVQWKANFYKIAENNSNPHYLTWSPVENSIPDFHLPAFFGTISFE